MNKKGNVEGDGDSAFLHTKRNRCYRYARKHCANRTALGQEVEGQFF